ncbi:MAG: P-II family nitrogen regulator [Polyangiaceae bacterium]|jgi:nitrogen regulatory protein PII
MTKIEAVVREQRVGPVLERLGLLGIGGLSVYPVKSAGHGEGRRLAIRGRTVVVAFVRKVMLEWCGPDELAHSIVRAIRHCADAGEPGDCAIFLQSADAVDTDSTEAGSEGHNPALAAKRRSHEGLPLSRIS